MPHPRNDDQLDAPLTALALPEGIAADDRITQFVREAGYRRHRRAKALEARTIQECNVRATMRDGVDLRVDIFRPEGQTSPVPAIVCWSPYGKSESAFKLDEFPFRAGIARSAVSDLQSWEGLDPAYWCARGYAVVNVDIRGARNSGGVMQFWNRQQAQDGYDTIEWLAKQDWCSGKIGLAGNSWLAIAQWFIAAQRPPHLAAIAPWEGFTDFYRHSIACGGIPDPGFAADVISRLVGRNGVADPVAKIRRDELYSQGWEDFAAHIEEIDVPAYVVASWTNFLHSEETLDAFLRLPTQQKWLRLHNSFEWSDYYEPKSVADLNRFFDRYLQDKGNGWEETPRCRLTVLDPGGEAVVERPESSYPPSRFEQRKLHLHADGMLANIAPVRDAGLSYSSTDKGRLQFRHVFDKEIETCGPMALSFDFAVENATNGDLYVTIRWIKRGGKRPLVRTMPLGKVGNLITDVMAKLGSDKLGMVFYEGPSGRLRVSRRHLDNDHSTPICPVHTFDRDEMLIPGQLCGLTSRSLLQA